MSERVENLRRLALPGGGVIGLAVDHRDSLREAAARRGWRASDEELTALKRRVIEGLSAEASLVLVDEELGAPILDSGQLPDGIGLAMPLEDQGYETVGDGRVTRLLDDSGPRQAATRGAHACKLLLPFRPDDADSAAAQEDVAARALKTCHAEGLPLILEPLVYHVAGEPLDAYQATFAELVIETARRLARIGPDVLKVQYPAVGPGVDSAASEALHEACAGVPWVLLGGGQEADAVQRQLADACRAGASGIIVGRTVWDAALVPDHAESTHQIGTVSRPILARLRRIVEAHAHPLVAG